MGKSLWDRVFHRSGPPEQPKTVADEGSDSLRPADLIEAIGEAVVVIGAGGEVELANGLAAELFGVSRPVVGRQYEQVITKAVLLDRIAGGLRGEPWHGPVHLSGPAGAVICEVSVVPIPGRSRVVLTLRDISELANAVQLKTDFVANASHELRTPIAAIKAAAETLELATEDEAVRPRLVSMVQSHAGRLEDLVTDLLDLSRLESDRSSPELVVVDMQGVSTSLVDGLRGLCRARRVEIAFEFSPELGRVVSDPKLLELILRNLIENAAKFTAEGTEVRVIAEPMEAGCRFRVIDQGPGIPLADQQRIFERFYQVDPARSGQHRGTGLGLAIVKHAVRLLGGEVRVESVWQQGTTMIVELPGGGG